MLRQFSGRLVQPAFLLHSFTRWRLKMVSILWRIVNEISHLFIPFYPIDFCYCNCRGIIVAQPFILIPRYTHPIFPPNLTYIHSTFLRLTSSHPSLNSFPLFPITSPNQHSIRKSKQLEFYSIPDNVNNI